MARFFDTIDDIIVGGAIAAMDTGDITMGAWIFPGSAGEGNAGQIIEISAVSNVMRQEFRFNTTGRQLRAQVSHATTNAISQMTVTNAPATNAWSVVFAVFTASDLTCRIYIGTLSVPVAEVAYATQTAGVGARTTGGVTPRIGNRNLTDRTFDGRIAQVLIDNRAWTLDEMEQFRLGRRPITTGSLRGFWPLESPTASQAEDLSGNGANGTVTGALVAEDPPVPMGWGGREATVSVLAYSLARTATDPLGAHDSLARLAGGVRVPQDLLGLHDTSSRLVALSRTASDVAGVADSAARTVGVERVAGDPVGLLDAAARAGAFGRSLADRAGLVDAASPSLAALRVAADAVAFADLVSLLLERQAARGCLSLTLETATASVVLETAVATVDFEVCEE